MRTVKRATLLLNKEKLTCLKKLCDAYGKEKRFFLDLLRDWDYQAELGCPRKIRDVFVESAYSSRYGLQARHWKLALQDAIETWDKYWEGLYKQIRQRISRHSLLSDLERHYAYWLLKGYSQFADLMKGNTPLPQFEIASESCHRVASYIRRTVKRIKGKAPTVKKSRIAKFDANCYEVFENEGTQYIKLMSQIPGKRICIPLCGKAKIKGNIAIVFSGDTVSIHVSHELKPKAARKGSREAVDFGYAEVMTDTGGIRYGTKFGQQLTRVSDDLHKKMQKRHKICALEKKNSQKRTYRKFNLGKKKFNNKKKAAKATLEGEINKAINELARSKNLAILITENLSHLFTYNKSKAMNRRLSSWLRGKIQERISFKALAEGFRHEQVNPAYGSQSCPECEFVDSKNRNGDRFVCVYCGHEDMADRVAAKNYARRFGDPEIVEYTPYYQVKTILLDRFHRRLEMGQPMTVPGRTLETVPPVHPPPCRNNELFVQPGENISKTGRSIRERNKK